MKPYIQALTSTILLGASISFTPLAAAELRQSCLVLSQEGWHQASQANGFNPELETEEEVLAAAEQALDVLDQARLVCAQAASEAQESQEAATLAAHGYLAGGWVLEERNRRREATQLYEEGIAAVIGLAGKSSPALVELYEKLSYRLASEQSYSEALRLLEQALSIRKETYGTTDPRIIRGLVLLGSFYSPRGLNPEERAIFERLGLDAVKLEDFLQQAVEIALDGEASAEQIEDALGTYGGFLLRQRRYEEAEAIRQLEREAIAKVQERTANEAIRQ